MFMEFYRDEKGNLTKLAQHNVDTGMGLERMCKVMQDKVSVYETDLFTPMLNLLAKTTGLSYAEHQRRFRIVADHIRTAFMLINDGLTPSNVGAGYVLRMIIRRAYYNLYLLKKIDRGELERFIADAFKAFEGLRDFDQQRITKVLLAEISQFEKTIASQIFMLYDTYGFPLEITKEIAQEKGIELDLPGYEKALAQAKEKSRQGSKEMFSKTTDWSKYLEGVGATEFVGYDRLDLENPVLIKDITTDDGVRFLVFDKTPFYPEMGGQV